VSSGPHKHAGGWSGNGNHCDGERVRLSGLWNNNHVDDVYDPVFLDIMVRHVEATMRERTVAE
jgi:hypothetical protein